VLQCVAVCCSVLQCVAVCCSVLQCAVVRCSVLQCVAVCCSMLQYVEVCCRVLQRVAVCCICCSMLQYVAVCCSMLQYVAGCCNAITSYQDPNEWMRYGYFENSTHIHTHIHTHTHIQHTTFSTDNRGSECPTVKATLWLLLQQGKRPYVYHWKRERTLMLLYLKLHDCYWKTGKRP